MLNSFIKGFVLAGLVLFSSLILLLTLRGKPGSPDVGELNQESWKADGPFELSPERGRYALTYSLVEDHSFAFSPHLAAFVTPDVSYSNGRFASLFPPLLSYIAIPGYMLGKQFGLAQVGSFAVIILFAISNLCLIYLIARKLGAYPTAGIIAAIMFLFGTPAFSYASTLYQHHVTTVLLLSVILVSIYNNFGALLYIFTASAAAVTLDTPNAIFFLPLALFAFTRFVTWEGVKDKLVLNIRFWRMMALTGAIIPLSFLLYFNYQSYGNMWQLGGLTAGAKSVNLIVDAETGELRPAETPDTNQSEPVQSKTSSPTGFFKTRTMMNGLYELLFSMDRGVLFFTPIIFISLMGIRKSHQENSVLTLLLLSSSTLILLLYASWADPYGGWAFGSRYLIPLYACLAPILAVTITIYRRNVIIILMFVVFGIYSIGVNTVGALTSNMNPPSNELIAMKKLYGSAPPEGYIYNLQQLVLGKSKSFMYNEFGKYQMDLLTYAKYIAGAITIWVLITLTALALTKDERRKQ